MSFEKPEYPDTLTRKNWEKNKSVLAKMKGYTGIGDALQELESQYKKVKWDETFDFKVRFGALNQYAQNGFTVQKLDAMVKAAVADVQSGECGRLRTAAIAARNVARDTAKDYEKSPVVPKKTTQLCRDIAEAADHLSVAVNINSMGPKLEAARREVMGPIDTTLTVLEKDYNRLLTALEHGVVPVVQHPSYDSWKGANLMKLCRDLNQVIGNAGKMADFGCDIGGDGASFRKFFDDMNLYARVAVPFEADAPIEEVKKHLAALIQLIKRAKALR